MLKKVRISLKTERYRVVGSLFEEETVSGKALAEGLELLQKMTEDLGDSHSQEGAEGEEWFPKAADEDNTTEVMEMTTEAVLRDDGDRVELRYEESELSGMQGAKTTVVFSRRFPELISMARGGSVNTALTFETGKRYLCAYQTPLMPFEVGVYTISVCNSFDEEGKILLDYMIEIRGAEAEHCKLLMTVKDISESPFPADREKEESISGS